MLNKSMCVLLIYVKKRQHRIHFGILDIQCHVRNFQMIKKVAVKVGTKAKFKRFENIIYYICFILHTFFFSNNLFLFF